MSEYYAVIRSTDHLAHYGVKGMKWGVRKAIESGNPERLLRHYKKAQKKLAKLNKKADLKRQQELAEKYKKKAVRTGIGTAVSGVAGLGSAIGLKSLAQVGRTPVVHHYMHNGVKKVSYDVLPHAAAAGTAIGSVASKVGLAKTIYDTGRAVHHKKLASKEGHAAAVTTRDHFKKEMKKAFAGTKYANFPSARDRNLHKKRRR